MGYQMAMRLATTPVKPEDHEPGTEPAGVRLHRGTTIHRGMQEHIMRNVFVWNRTKETARQHSEEFHTRSISEDVLGPDNLGRCSIVLMCLPTSDVTFEMVKSMAPHFAEGTILVDCCTGHPTITRRISAWLAEERPGVVYMDCPISGGPGGASQGTLACFVGGDEGAAEIIRPHLEAFAKNVVYLGPVGAGHAVKAVNNACNVSNLLCLHEGLLSLCKMGVDPTAALEVINKSSGRSLMSQARVPEEVVTGDFNYGFKLGLMAKDVAIACDLIDEYYPDAKIYKHTLKVHYDAMAAGVVGFESDYTEIVKFQEKFAQAQLRPKDGEKAVAAAAAVPQTVPELQKAVRDLQVELARLQGQAAS